MLDEASRTIIIFGPPGSGKSSVISMLLEDDSNSPIDSNLPSLQIAQNYGCNPTPFYHKSYEVSICEFTYLIYDVTGVAEDTPNFTSSATFQNLQNLVRNLALNGPSLLILCVRGPEIKRNTKRNFHLFFDGIFNKEIPIALVVTGLEDEKPTMESWWARNNNVLNKFRIRFSAHACITASRHAQERYFDSRNALKSLIVQHAVAPGVARTEKDTKVWLASIAKRFVGLAGGSVLSSLRRALA
ncbi:hypothetical protein GYMLUDRAFT_541773 [Collybiopsis luxurians FD-317 M1]|nr:hypothetical protein GYMLUDRAFT_541773 [Collybiopsis luxurians FD-317 M1]